MKKCVVRFVRFREVSVGLRMMMMVRYVGSVGMFIFSVRVVRVVKIRVISRLLFVDWLIIFVNFRGRLVVFRIVMMILMVLIVISR